jgi:hypothetical protein
MFVVVTILHIFGMQCHSNFGLAFDKLQELQDSSRVKGVAQAVYDIEAIFGTFTLPTYIFFSHCADGKDEWSGRVAAITSAVRSRGAETDMKIDSRCAETDMKIDSLRREMVELDKKMVETLDSNAKMEAKFDAKFAVLLEKLDQLRPTTVTIEDGERLKMVHLQYLDNPHRLPLLNFKDNPVPMLATQLQPLLLSFKDNLVLQLATQLQPLPLSFKDNPAQLLATQLQPLLLSFKVNPVQLLATQLQPLLLSFKDDLVQLLATQLQPLLLSSMVNPVQLIQQVLLSSMVNPAQLIQ